MKKLILSTTILAAIASSMTFTSCKKGENDPAISFKSRKSRVTGEWAVSSMESTASDTYASGGVTITDRYVTNFDGTTFTYTETEADGDVSETKANVTEWSFIFEKDGTYSSMQNITITEYSYTPSGGPKITTTQTTCNVYTYEELGNWSFIGKDKDGEYKSKERIVLNTTTENETEPSGNCQGTDKRTSTYANGENATIWDIDQLKSKEIIVKMNSNNVVTDSPNGGTTTSSTYIEEGTMTLTAK